MQLKTLWIFVLFLFIAACSMKSGLEESVIIYDPQKQELFIKLLKEQGLDYRVQQDGQINYPVEQKEQVLKAFEKATGKKLQDLTGES
ncbi:MAG: hypothetical protein R3240_07050 [Gammaproteobacteria bacterium]|nr:hypothetical protein [Gammaproteobacteria bacterium]